MSEIETPAAIERTEHAIRSDLAKASALFGEGSALLEGLEESLRVLPASQSRIKGWRNQVDLVLGGIAEEQADISRKLLGGPDPNPIEQRVDEAHADRVIALKREA